jgi:hypothetical protein
MRNRRLLLLLVFLSALLAAGAVEYWPTPRRMAMSRIKALDGTYVEQTDIDGGPHQIFTVMLTLRPVSEEDLAVLKHLRPIHRLLLDGSPVTDAGLVHISELAELELLNLTGSQVTDDGLAALAQLKNLKMLSLGRTKVTDAGLVHLHALTRLQTLNLYGTAVTDRGAEELQRALPSLRRIDLHPDKDDD